MPIIRYTTPTIRFEFSEIDVTDIAVAWLVIKQGGQTVIERSLDTAEVIHTQNSDSLSWTLTQVETKNLSKALGVQIYCDWKLQDGTRGRSHVKAESVEETGKQEVI